MLAADIATPPGHDSFETLRILGEADEPAPWQPRRAGFTLGEAAVALRLAPGRADAGALLGGPVLGHDLEGDDGLARVLAALPPAAPWLVLAQGTGPAAADRAELDAIGARLAADVPITSALHTSDTRWARPACCPSRSPRSPRAARSRGRWRCRTPAPPTAARW